MEKKKRGVRDVASFGWQSFLISQTWPKGLLPRWQLVLELKGVTSKQEHVIGRQKKTKKTNQKTSDWNELVSIWRLVSQHVVVTADLGGFPHRVRSRMESLKTLSAWNGNHELVRQSKVERLKVRCIGGCLHTLCVWEAQSCRKETGALPASQLFWQMYRCVYVQNSMEFPFPHHLYELEIQTVLNPPAVGKTYTKLKWRSDHMWRARARLHSPVQLRAQTAALQSLHRPSNSSCALSWIA